jgi:homoserine dehydrogenase
VQVLAIILIATGAVGAAASKILKKKQDWNKLAAHAADLCKVRICSSHKLACFQVSQCF